MGTRAGNTKEGELNTAGMEAGGVYTGFGAGSPSDTGQAKLWQ